MRKKSVIAILPIIVAVVRLFSFSPAQAKICDYEVKYFTYMTPNGASSAKLELVGKSLDGIAAKVLQHTIKLAIDKAGGILKLSEAMRTDKALRNVHIFYLYRFIHQKQVGVWRLGHKTRVTRNGVDYFQPKDLPGAVVEGKKQIERQLDKELEKDCKNHQ